MYPTSFEEIADEEDKRHSLNLSKQWQCHACISDKTTPKEKDNFVLSNLPGPNRPNPNQPNLILSEPIPS